MAGHRPFTPRQQRQNLAFLAALRRTGNVRLTCRELGVNRSTWEKRRRKCAAFAALWDMVLAAAHAACQRAGGECLPAASGGDALRTKGGEPMIVRLGNGRLQRRLAPPGRMTEAAEQRILARVEETNNLRLAAAAAGFAHTSFLARARLRPAVAGQLQVARRIGADRVMWQCLHPPGRPEPADAEFAHLPMPPTTAEQAIFQLAYHRPDGPLQRSFWRRRPRPIPFARVEPRIRAKLAAFRRASWHRETGKWRFPDEE